MTNMDIPSNKEYNIKPNLGYKNVSQTNYSKIFTKGSQIYNTHISDLSTINTLSNSLICQKQNKIYY